MRIRRHVYSMHDIETDSLSIKIVQFLHGNKRSVAKWNPDEQCFDWVEYNECEKSPSTFKFPRELAQELMSELCGLGIEPHSESKLKGKLEATERHLQDLRHMLKLPQKKE